MTVFPQVNWENSDEIIICHRLEAFVKFGLKINHSSSRKDDAASIDCYDQANVPYSESMIANLYVIKIPEE